MANERFPFNVTPSSLTVMIDGKTHTLTEDSHVNYAKIREALKQKDFEAVRELIDVATSINVFGEGKVVVKDGVIYYGDLALHNSLTTRILQQMEEGFDVDPMVKFLENLMQNPSKRAVDELYSFLEQNALPITEDGYFVAYKRVTTDFKDFYTRKMDNSVGKLVQMARNQVNDDKDQTCSQGLHFCSLEYLPHYYCGQGRVVILKINPRDVVSIPTDYNNAKGRACEYLVLEEYTGGETREKFDTSIYDTGTGHHVDEDAYDSSSSSDDMSWGFYDSSSSSSELFEDDPVTPAAPGSVEERVKKVIHEQLGIDVDDIKNTDSIITDLGADSLDLIELVMAVEDEFGFDIDDTVAHTLQTVQQVIDMVEAKLAAQPPAVPGAAWPFPHVATPVAPQPGVPVAGVMYTREQACQILKISKDALRKRLARGTSVELVTVNGVEYVRIL